MNLTPYFATCYQCYLFPMPPPCTKILWTNKKHSFSRYYSFETVINKGMQGYIHTFKFTG